MRRQQFVITLILFLCSLGFVSAEGTKGDNEHVRNWNKFADDTLQLHKQLTAKTAHHVRSRVGGYFGNKDFYTEKTFHAKHNGKLISRVQWERENPDALHSIEVFIHDAEGRVIRDFTAAYLPTYRNAPTQTLISFHNYNDQLHAFRTFDASAYRIVERCEGTLDGKEVNMLLDEDEIAQALDGDSNIMESREYKACFDGLREKLGKYRIPQ